MRPFTIWNPTRILFGPDHAAGFAAEVAKLGRRALVVTGGGSVKRLGYLDTVTSALTNAGLAVEQFAGNEPNPNAPTVNKAAEQGRQFKADVTVPVGGGSVMDARRRSPPSSRPASRLLWASTLSLNGYRLAGRTPAEFVLHSMEHALSGFKSDLAHGRGLAALYPSYCRWLLADGRATHRMAKLGAAVFGPGVATADAFIDRFEGWLRQNRLLQSLEQLGFDPQQYPAVADYCVKVYGTDGRLNALGPLTEADIVGIFDGTRRQAT